jgi:hypothetical protein
MSNMLPSQAAPVTRVVSGAARSVSLCFPVQARRLRAFSRARPGLCLWPSSPRFLAAVTSVRADAAFRSRGWTHRSSKSLIPRSPG